MRVFKELSFDSHPIFPHLNPVAVSQNSTCNFNVCPRDRIRVCPGDALGGGENPLNQVQETHEPSI